MRPTTTLGAHSQALLFVHLVWSTKRRQPLIDDRVEHASNHVHALVQLAQKVSVSSLAHHLKGMTSRMISLHLAIPFEWQDGYWAQSVGFREVPTVERYLATQRAAHDPPDPPWIKPAAGP